jgi:hypothetical protein
VSKYALETEENIQMVVFVTLCYRVILKLGTKVSVAKGYSEANAAI